ncbi:MAG: hypothetical protein ABR521_10410 [Gaiellaceae bacterium]
MLVTGAAAALGLTFVLAASAATYSNPSPLVIPDATGFNPVTPGQVASNIQVTEASTVTSVTVTIQDLMHEVPDDLDIVLANPSNTRVVLMSDAGGTDPIQTNTDLRFQAGGATLPDESLIAEGTYQPANYGKSQDPFCGAETDPTGTFTTNLATFNGQPAQGTWTLTVQDDCQGFTGRIGGGWCLVINTSSGPCAGPTAAFLKAFGAARTSRGVRLSWRTAQETDVVGFDVYRSRGGRLAKVNRTLVPARHAGAARGATYGLLDRSAARGRSTYRLEVLKADGSRVFAGVATT